MWQNWAFDAWHAIISGLSGNEMYCESDLITRYSSGMEYSNDFLRIWWSKGILCILYRLNWSDLSTRGCVVQHTECLTSWMIEVSWTCTYTKWFHLPIGVGLIWGVQLVQFLAKIKLNNHPSWWSSLLCHRGLSTFCSMFSQPSLMAVFTRLCTPLQSLMKT